MPASKVSVVLPCLNEKDNIVPLVRRILALLPPPREVLVVDDDSPDGTADAVRLEFSGHPEVRLLVRAGGRGLASALRYGIALASGDIVAWMDCDFSMPPERLAALVAAVRDGSCDAAVGSRFAAGGVDRRLGCRSLVLVVQAVLSLIISRLAMLLLRRRLRDWTSGFIAVRRDALTQSSLRGDFGEYFIVLVNSLLDRGCRVRELPYEFGLRRHGASKIAGSLGGLFRRGPKYVLAVLDCLPPRKWTQRP
ncbi:MAG TPA: polyprenol monophosphomannose synthase [Elusimicrobia bacterium]|nr:polyprenol monophosphomannose synthase [Elusimicrobiota bacterium]HBT61439.1 polyprenol monophosphomannose synthase [Elusimicrobiota bacterium]